MIDSPYMTTNEIADANGWKRTQVDYVVRKNKIPHVGRVGIIRIFDRSIIPDIARGLAQLREYTLSDAQIAC